MGNTGIGTNSGTYTVQAADIDSTITVTVTHVYNSGGVTSPPTATVPITLAEQLARLRTNAQSNTEYTLEVRTDEALAPQTLPTGRSNLTIILKGDGAMRTLSLTANGSLFTVDSGVTLVLDGGITLQGRAGNKIC